jgi:cell division protein ZapB
MSEIENAASENPGKSGGKKGLIIGIIIILLLINGIQYFLGTQKETQIKEKIVLIEKAEGKNKALITTLDSIQVEMTKRLDEITRLGGDTATLAAQIRQLEKDKITLLKSASSAKAMYNKIKGDIEGYKEMLRQKDEEIAKLTQERDHFYGETVELKTTVAKKDSNITVLEKVKRELDEKVQLAQVLKAEKIHVSAISKKNKEKKNDKEVEEFKAKAIDKLKVTFNLAENKVAKVESKEILLRVLGPDGAAIYNESTGGGAFKFEGKDIYYTEKQSVFYDGKNPEVTFLYSKGTPYAQGTHTIEIYCEGHLIGTHQLKVK